MKKEDITAIAHMLTSMKESAEKLDIAVRQGDAEKLATLKREILGLQAQINSLL